MQAAWGDFSSYNFAESPNKNSTTRGGAERANTKPAKTGEHSRWNNRDKPGEHVDQAASRADWV